MDGAPGREASPRDVRALRVAVVTETYLPEVNGVAMTMGHLVRGLIERGHAVELVRPRQRPAEVAAQRPPFEELLVRGVAIPRYNALKLGLPAKSLLLRHWSVRRPDIVHLVTEGPLGWSALTAANALELPVTSDFHTNFHTYSAHYGIGWLERPITAYLRRFHNGSHRTLVPTPELRGELAALGFENLVVVARGVDTGLFNPIKRDLLLRRQWRAAPGDPVALFVSRLAPEKNLLTALETFESMRKNDARVKLVVVGDGPERAAIEPRYPDVIFAGARYGSDLAAHYASADIFLFPSLSETYGNVTVEALASGLVVVAFRYAAAAQHIHDGENGVTVPYGDHEAFVKAALDLLRDRERRMRMGARARASMTRLDWRHIVDDFESTLLEVTAASPGGGHAHAYA